MPIPANFAAKADHELRAPLASIHVALQLALAGSREMLRAEDREMLEISIKSTERLVRWVNGFIDRPAHEADAWPAAAFGPLAALPLTEEAVRAMRPLALARRVTIACASDEGLPPIDADRDAIARVLANLLSQAIERSAAGGTVRVSLRRASGGVEFAVADEGAGGSPLPQSPARLAASRAIVEQHGGRLAGVPLLPAGYRFSFILPPAEGGEAEEPTIEIVREVAR